MKIMGFDTAAKTASVAITEDGNLLSEFYLDSGFTHSETVLPMAKSLLEAVRMEPSDIDLFAVNVGPGSFTGLRIGIAAVKAMAMSLNKPCVGVSTLEALAKNVSDRKAVICSAMDARCDQVYAAFFESDGAKLLRKTEDSTLKTEALFDEIKKLFAESGEKLLMVGDGAMIMQKKFGDEFFCAAPKQLLLGHGYGVCLAAEEYIKKGEITDAAGLVPNYLKLAQAEKEKLEKEGKL